MTFRSTKQVRIMLLAPFVLMLLFAFQRSLNGQESYWIWSPQQNVKNLQESECFFRKKFTLVRPEKAELYIAAGDRYELYINGRVASEGESYGNASHVDVSSLLEPGVNLVAVKVVHTDSARVGLAIKLRVKEKDETRWRSLVTDATWKTREKQIEPWKSTGYNDIGWLAAQQLEVATLFESSAAQSTANNLSPPASGNQPAPPVVAPQDNSLADRFDISSEFTVQQVLLDNETGSLIAMAFNEFGKLILSREGGPLMIADPGRPLQDSQRIRILCNEVNSCQGILPLNGDVYVTGNGPQGLALYRLTDKNLDGVMEVAGTLLRFTGETGEHGPHGLALGTDGMIYVVIGNGSQVKEEVAATSPYQYTYEGDFVPRYEDPGGHAKGVKAPGGTIVRVALDGSQVERVAGGLRNCYDVVFNADGELFAHDSDMESDMGMAWYRPTRVFPIHAGAEIGWRSGWAKFPDYYLDATPAVADTGRGSPTGAVLYQHLQFPARYHDSVFLADWSEGRILAMRTNPDGASYTAHMEEFLKGRPLNVCDLDVGQDGALYFCTGGRGTAGGVYRIVWNGRVPENMLSFDSELEKIVRHPQPSAAWARQNIAKLKEKMGTSAWDQALIGVVSEKRNTVKFRLQAMDKMVLYGPFPSAELLGELARDENAEIRCKAAQLCGLKLTSAHVELLDKLITDDSSRVRRVACESYLRLGKHPSVDSLHVMLDSSDRIESMVARRVLEKMPTALWQQQVLEVPEIRVFMNGALALMTAHPTLENAYEVLARSSHWMDGFVSDRDFIDLLRVIQLAMLQGQVEPAKIPAFTERIRNEFPSGNGTINRQLAQLMAYMKIGSVEGRIGDYLASHSDSDEDKLFVAMYLQTIGQELANSERMALIAYLEQAFARPGGGSYKVYLARAIRDVAATITTDQVVEILDNAERMPNAVISAFYKMPRELDAQYIERIKQVDQRAKQSQSEQANQIRLGVIAVLAQSGNAEAMNYLRQLWQEEPERRGDISIGLAQEPADENWAYLVSSLPVLDDLTATEVLEKLASVPRRPRDAVHYREVIKLGYRLRADGAKNVARLLEHWAGESTGPVTDDWTMLMDRWKAWFERKYPNEPVITLQQPAQLGAYSTDQVLAHLENNGLGNAERGKHIYAKAQCALCHRLGANGLAAGPDLTSLTRRFSKREIIESIINPSDVVSDQYRAMTILTEDGQTFNGMAAENSDGSWLVLQADGKRVRIEKDNVDRIKESDLSPMPAHLLDNLSMEEIADLMAFLEQGDSYQSSNTDSTDVR
jgi:putative heme-binding domain-containing protein